MKNRHIKTKLLLSCLRIVLLFGILIGAGINLGYLVDLLPGQGPTWHGIEVGKSSDADVISRLGEPDQTVKTLGGSELIYKLRNQSGVPIPVTVTVRWGYVQKVEESLLNTDKPMPLEELVAEHGIPRSVAWSTNYLGGRILVYPQEGLLAEVMVSPYHKTMVWRFVYYKPTPHMLIYLKFYDLLRYFDPSPDTDVIGPKDPWFGTSDSCRHSC